ncbi:hypothetical protein ACWETD_28715, partial [Micromonospora chokoriensis]
GETAGVAEQIPDVGSGGAVPPPRRARIVLAESRRLREETQPTAGLARTLLYLGDACAALGEHADARRHWADAATVAEEVADGQALAAADARLDDDAADRVT